tara:strand:+ start:374 stop:808 length:435 start_codon:yes stop_codon:yes gene_type:complete
MKTLVDQYTDRYFDPRRGQVIGVNYSPNGQAIEYELGLGNGKRMAGSALGIGIDGLKDLLYRPGIDEAGIDVGPYNPDTDDYGLELLLASAEHPKFRAGAYSQIGARPKGLQAIGPDALNSLPNSEIAKDKYMKIRNAISLPKF